MLYPVLYVLKIYHPHTQFVFLFKLDIFIKKNQNRQLKYNKHYNGAVIDRKTFVVLLGSRVRNPIWHTFIYHQGFL